MVFLSFGGKWISDIAKNLKFNKPNWEFFNFKKIIVKVMKV